LFPGAPGKIPLTAKLPYFQAALFSITLTAFLPIPERPGNKGALGMAVINGQSNAVTLRPAQLPGQIETNPHNG
jgi:hypothetical protein